MTLSEQAATGCADRETVAAALGWVRTEFTATDYWPDLGPSRWHMWCRAGEPYVETAPDYQRDLPATLAEIERRGWDYELTNIGGKFGVVWVDCVSHEKPGTTIANAACAALLQALEQQAMTPEIDALRAENARLREALTENAAASAALTVRIVRDGWSETYTLHGATKDEVQRLLASQNAARAALTPATSHE